MIIDWHSHIYTPEEVADDLGTLDGKSGPRWGERGCPMVLENFLDAHYKNGIDMHLDWGASKFLTKQLQVGLVGYVYDQITPDSGSGDRVGCFQSQVFGIGPQFGYVFPLSETLQGYINLKGYAEFGASDRPQGWNTWLTFVISPAAAPPPAPRRMVTK